MRKNTKNFLEKYNLTWRDIITLFICFVVVTIPVLSLIGFLPKIIFPVCCLLFGIMCFIRSSHNTIIVGLVFWACAIIEFVKLCVL